MTVSRGLVFKTQSAEAMRRNFKTAVTLAFIAAALLSAGTVAVPTAQGGGAGCEADLEWDVVARGRRAESCGSGGSPGGSRDERQSCRGVVCGTQGRIPTEC